MEVIDRQDVFTALKTYGLSVPLSSTLTGLRSFSNHVWQVTDKNHSYILRRYSKLTHEDLLRMNSNLAYLTSLNIPIPQILINSDGQPATQVSGRAYDLSIFIPHVVLKYPDMNITTYQIKQAAELLAKIHTVPIGKLPNHLPNIFIDEVNYKYILNLIDAYRKEFPTLVSLANQIDKIKLSNLNELIKLTEDNRKTIIERQMFSVEHFPKALSHGDFSLSNLLPTLSGEKMYLIDWENMGLRTRAWELHRTLLLLCGKGYCNANFDEPDFQRATIFLNSYLGRVKMRPEEILSLPEIAEYIAYFHWLRFTLESILKKDNRILDRIPNQIEQGLWWKYNSQIYADWIRKYL